MANIDFSLIDFQSSHLQLNPVFPESLKQTLAQLVSKHFDSRPLVWIMSSGTTSPNTLKLIGLSHSALLSSAQAVNQHLQVQDSDRWLNILPLFHVGGLGILYRIYQSATEGYNFWTPEYKWDPYQFINDCKNHQATLTSLVPTQVYDLVAAKLSPPSHLRAIVAGGARLNNELYIKARALGWPLLPSFGMTEASSQIATASLESLSSSPATFSEVSTPPLQLLSHIQAKIDANQRLSLRGPSLLEGYYPIANGIPQDWCSPKDEQNWFRTQDCAQINDRHLEVLGRTDEVIKINGENVNLASLRHRLEEIKLKFFKDFTFDCTLISLPDDRAGNQIILVGTATSEALAQLLSRFNTEALPFERIHHFKILTQFPRTSLGKVLHSEIIDALTQSVSSPH